MAPMMERLRGVAADCGLTLGAKFTNTLVVRNHRDFFDTDDMYLSGQPLHVVAMAIFAKFRRRFPDIPASFSAGVDRGNFADCVALGLTPITTCTDLGDAELQMGDVHVVAEFQSALGPLVLDLYASGTVGAELTIYDVPDAPDALGIEAVNTGKVVLDLQSFEGDLTLFSYEAIELLLASILSDVLAGDLLVGLVGAFPLPSVTIGGYVPGLAEDATLFFDPHTLNGVGAHRLLGGDLSTE